MTSSVNYIVECEWKAKPGKWSAVARTKFLESAKEEANDYDEFIKSGQMGWSRVRIMKEETILTQVLP